MQTQTRDRAAFRRAYDLPTDQEYLRLLASPDQEAMGRLITAREQAAVALLRAAGFDGSTLGEAFEWWRSQGADDQACDRPQCGHGFCGCH